MPPQCQLFCPFLLKRWTERENEREKILKEIEIQISGLTYRTESTEREREQIETEINKRTEDKEKNISSDNNENEMRKNWDLKKRNIKRREKQ